MPVACEKCGSNDLDLVKQLPDSRREIKCLDCGHTWLRGTAAAPPAPPQASSGLGIKKRSGSSGARIRSGRGGTGQDLKQFIKWLEDYENKLAGARIVLRRHENADGQNLTGHVKQSFYGTLLFLRENEHLINVLSSELDKLGTETIYDPQPAILDAWSDFLEANQNEKTDIYSFETLAGILPPALGGRRLHGGGGVSTLKRMLPLVARYLKEKK